MHDVQIAYNSFIVKLIPDNKLSIYDILIRVLVKH